MNWPPKLLNQGWFAAKPLRWARVKQQRKTGVNSTTRRS